MTTHLQLDDLIQRLNTLAQVSSALALDLDSEDLKNRCNVLAKGAEAATRILKTIPAKLVLKQLNRNQTVTTSRNTKDLEIETRLLCELARLALVSGICQDGLTLLEAVGTVLHGKVGGPVFKIDALLSLGHLEEANAIYKSEIFNIKESAMNAEAIFLSLWVQRGNALWASLKIDEDRNTNS